jgi:hypothetical protein
MAEIERILPTTKVSQWLASAITGESISPPPTGNAGYFIGGYNSSNLDSIDRIDMDDDTRFTIAATLTYPQSQIGGISNSGVAGYVAGGAYNPGSGWTGRLDIQKLTYDGDTTSVISATLANTGRRQLGDAGMSNQGTAGYWAGGYST